MEYKPIYIFYGKQNFRFNEAVFRLRKKLSENDDLDFVEFDNQTKPYEVINIANTMSLNQSKKIITYRNIEKFKEPELDLLLEYSKKPNLQTVLLLWAQISKKSDSILKSKLTKYCEKNKYAFALDPLVGSKLIDWINKKTALSGGKINHEASHYLQEFVGSDLQVLDNEIKKLCTYCNGAEIILDDVRKLTIDTKENTVFDLVDAIGRKDPDDALLTLNKVVLDGEAPLKIFHMIHRQFKMIFETKILIDQGSSPNQIAGKLRLPVFVISKYKEQGRNFSESSLRKIFELLCDTDYRIKTGSSQSLTLERMIVECIKT